MESPIAISFEGADADVLQKAMTSTLQQAGLRVDEAALPAAGSDSRGADLPFWFKVFSEAVSSAANLGGLASFFLGLRDRRKRSASEQADEIQLAEEFLSQIKQHNDLDAAVVLHNRNSGRVLRLSIQTSVAELDQFRSEAMHSETTDE